MESNVKQKTKQKNKKIKRKPRKTIELLTNLLLYVTLYTFYWINCYKKWEGEFANSPCKRDHSIPLITRFLAYITFLICRETIPKKREHCIIYIYIYISDINSSLSNTCTYIL